MTARVGASNRQRKAAAKPLSVRASVARPAPDARALLDAIREAVESRANLERSRRESDNPEFAYFAWREIESVTKDEVRAAELLAAFVDERIAAALNETGADGQGYDPVDGLGPVNETGAAK